MGAMQLGCDIDLVVGDGGMKEPTRLAGIECHHGLAAAGTTLHDLTDYFVLVMGRLDVVTKSFRRSGCFSIFPII